MERASSRSEASAARRAEKPKHSSGASLRVSAQRASLRTPAQRVSLRASAQRASISDSVASEAEEKPHISDSLTPRGGATKRPFRSSSARRSKAEQLCGAGEKPHIADSSATAARRSDRPSRSGSSAGSEAEAPVAKTRSNQICLPTPTPSSLSAAGRRQPGARLPAPSQSGPPPRSRRSPGRARAARPRSLPARI